MYIVIVLVVWSIIVDCVCCFFFFFKQKTAYEMRISDWSSDVCSSDLRHHEDREPQRRGRPDDAFGLETRALQAEQGLARRRRDADQLRLRDDQHAEQRDQAAEITHAPAEPAEPADLLRRFQSRQRSEERRVGKGWVSSFRSRWSPQH